MNSNIFDHQIQLLNFQNQQIKNQLSLINNNQIVDSFISSSHEDDQYLSEEELELRKKERK
jgi:hypothetical protein